MNVSNHGKARMRQRGITQDDVDLILAHGEHVHMPGNATEYHLKKQTAEMLVKQLRKEINVLSKMCGKAVLMSRDGAIVTVYRKA